MPDMMDATAIPMWALPLAGWALMATVMAVFWLIYADTNAGVVDVAWSFGIGVLVLAYAPFVYAAGGSGPRVLLAALLPALWSFRLGTYIFGRVFSETEDRRYRQLREDWGDSSKAFFFWFFQAQALLDVIFSIPPLIVMLKPAASLTVFDVAGIAIWVVAVGGETIADRQLARWRANPDNNGKTCKAGLWRYSRHPNYFFEWVHWWAYVVMAIGSPLWWVTLGGPALMLLFLWKITGIPATEAHAVKSRDDYAEYQRTTSAFIPWFPKESDA